MVIDKLQKHGVDRMLRSSYYVTPSNPQRWEWRVGGSYGAHWNWC